MPILPNSLRDIAGLSLSLCVEGRPLTEVGAHNGQYTNHGTPLPAEQLESKIMGMLRGLRSCAKLKGVASSSSHTHLGLLFDLSLLACWVET